jgi:phosphate transport system permease protein
MSRAADGHFAPRIRARKLAGAAFGLACLLATLTGVVVLSVLLVSVVAAALRRPPDAPWHAVGSHARELGGLLRQWTTRFGSRTPGRAGFRAGIAGSVWLLALVTVIAIPVGVGAAVFLEEFVPPGRIRRAIQTNIANLAGVPSIVYGILGLTLFARAFGVAPLALGKTLWAGALTLSLLVLPVIVIATQEALRAVPSSLRQAALALGATRWQVVRDHVLPSAVPGILTGTILALSRAIGETAPLLMVGAAASIRWVPAGPSDLYTALPVEIYNYAKEPDPAYAAVAAGGILILLALLLTMNAAAILIRNRYGRHS